MFWTRAEGWAWLDKNLPKRIKNGYQDDGSFLIQTDNYSYNDSYFYIPDLSIIGWDSILTHYDYDFFLKFREKIIALLCNDYQIHGYMKYISTDSRFYTLPNIPIAEIPIDSSGNPTMIFFKKIKKKG